MDNLNSIFNDIDVLISNLTSLKKEVTIIQNKAKTIKKQLLKKNNTNIIKQSKKNSKKPSGFANPTNISKELCEFLNKDEGTKIARTDVTKYIIAYIKDNNLGNSIDKRKINPDTKLKNLLNINEDTNITYFNIQKFMNKHFIPQNIEIKEENELNLIE